MAKNKKDIYFAADESDVLVTFLQKKAQAWFQTLNDSNHLDTIKRSWQAYHGVYYEDSHAIGFSGEAGELVNLPINHYRNIAQNVLTMTTATRPSFQARAINTDLKSQIQTNLANGLLEYYMRDKRLEQDLKKAVEYAIVMGTGYIKMDWNSTSGEIYDVMEPEYAYEVDEEGNEVPVIDEETGEQKELTPGFPIYEGDVEFTVLSPFDVVFDTTKESPKQDWQLCRTFKNKYDLAAKYPELEEEILDIKTKSEATNSRISLAPFDETVDVPVYEFFHKPTESVPRGRYVLYLDKDVVLMDTILPYRKLPVFRISPADILGTPYGYTPMFDLLPIQDGVNSLYSTILTNQHTFGVQSIYAERDSGISVSELSSGLNLFEGNPGSAPPQALNLTQTPGEVFNFLQMLERAMEVVSGINSVARGNPDPKQNLRSGNALALIQSQALQFISGLQQSYIYLIEDVGTNLVTLLQDFAQVPRIAQIAGKANASMMKEFTGEDLNAVNRVIVDAGNALSQTTAGRSEMATQMMQMGLIKTPEQYLSVINTGKLETMTEGQNKQLLLIRAENERLIDGKVEVNAILTHDHSLHIREHQAVLSDPDLALDSELVIRTLGHIQEHMNLWLDPANAPLFQGLRYDVPPQMAAPMPAPGPAPVPGPQDPNLLNNAPANDPGLQTQMSEELPQPAEAPTETDLGAPTTAAQQFGNLIGQ